MSTPDDEGTAVPPVFVDIDEPFDTEPEKPATPPPPPAEPPKRVIPKLPKQDQLKISDAEMRAGIPAKAAAAANLKLRGASYQKIAEVLEYEHPRDAQSDVLKVLAMTHSPDEWETMRVVAGARAEMLLEQALDMASADYLVDATTGEHLPNDERRLWHAAAGVALMNWVTITGAKAPSKVEITPGEVQLENIVRELIDRTGHTEVHEADVLELEVLPPDAGNPDDDIYG
jgi:hypothetical protein